MSDLTQLLDAAAQGDAGAAEQVLPLVYQELRGLAAGYLQGEKPGQTLQPTALVHEAYVRLVGGSPSSHYDNRGHFFAAAAEAMRRILVENARRKQALKHGGGRGRVELTDPPAPRRQDPATLLAMDEALDSLARKDPAAAQVVKLHFFVGLSMDEAADLMGIARATAYRHWTYARAWLRCAMADAEFEK